MVQRQKNHKFVLKLFTCVSRSEYCSSAASKLLSSLEYVRISSFNFEFSKVKSSILFSDRSSSFSTTTNFLATSKNQYLWSFPGQPIRTINRDRK